jgi:hypothetical protein
MVITESLQRHIAQYDAYRLAPGCTKSRVENTTEREDGDEASILVRRAICSLDEPGMTNL